MKSLFLAVASFAVAAASNCWKDAYGRGAGEVITYCPPDQEKNGALCYPLCKEGFYGVGPVCWQYCPDGFRDDGAFCAKPGPYGRGAGYPLWDEDKCNRDNKELGCEKWGLIWYPRCRAGFHNVACCICSPNCPSDMVDIGVSCTKHSYGRGAGYVLQCRPEQEMSGLLCYPPCKNGYAGNGPVCWQQCPAGKVNCGGALCVDSPELCTDFAKSVATNAVTAAVAIAVAVLSGGTIGIMQIIQSIGGVAIDLANGICETPKYSEFEQF